MLLHDAGKKQMQLQGQGDIFCLISQNDLSSYGTAPVYASGLFPVRTFALQIRVYTRNQAPLFEHPAEKRGLLRSVSYVRVTMSPVFLKMLPAGMAPRTQEVG